MSSHNKFMITKQNKVNVIPNKYVYLKCSIKQENIIKHFRFNYYYLHY